MNKWKAGRKMNLQPPTTLLEAVHGVGWGIALQSWRSFLQACSHGGCLLGAAPAKIAVLGLLCSLRGCSLVPTPVKQ